MIVHQWLREYFDQHPEFDTAYKAMTVLGTFYREHPLVFPSRGFPLPLVELLRWLQVTRVTRSNIGCSASLDSTVEPPVIWLRAEESIPVQRFAICHQLGHLFLHQRGQWDYTVPEHSREERAANDFAAALLVPMQYCYPEIRKNGMDVDKLASKFGVSRTVMLYRLKTNGMHP